MAYVYRHIRLDKNVPFYIGIGSDEDGKYDRAYNKRHRNMFWKKITAFTKYDVEILMDGIKWDYAVEKEKEFIKLYGRKDLGTGILCNGTDGGDGANNLSKESRDRIIAPQKKKVCKYDKNGMFIKLYDSLSEAAKDVGATAENIGGCAKFRVLTAKGYIFRYYEGHENNVDLSTCVINYELVKRRLVSNRKYSKINQYTLGGDYINTFENIAIAARITKIHKASISLCVNGKNKTAYGYIFKRFNGNKDSIEVGDLSQRKTFKRVDRFSKSGEYIDSFNSRIEASEKTGVRKDYISACCIGIQPSAGGFVWKNSKTINND